VLIVKFVRALPKQTAGFELGRQLLRAGTSITANVEEAQGAFSKDDFIYKMQTALKEARETSFWLRLIRDSFVAKLDGLESLIRESNELKNILASIVKSSKVK
jgi:four helix bundle protein